MNYYEVHPSSAHCHPRTHIHIYSGPDLYNRASYRSHYPRTDPGSHLSPLYVC